MKKKPKTRLVYTIDEQLRRSNSKKAAFLKWLNRHCRNRRPTIAEIIRACKTDRDLRGLMETDAARAAQNYWHEQAQYLLRHINVVRINIVTREPVSKPVRAYIPIRYSSGGRINEADYVSAKRVADNPSLRHTVLQKAHADFQAWLSRYERYVEFLNEFSPVLEAYRAIESTTEAA